MERWLRDIVQATRRLGGARLFSATVLVVIITSVAVTAAMSSLATGVLQRALPYPDAARLVRVNEFSRAQEIPEMPASLESVRIWREQSSIFEDFGVAHAPLNLTLESADGAVRLLGGLVAPEMFATLDVQPVLGRAFGPDEGTIGAASSSVVLSHEVWTRVFGQDPATIGRTLTINGLPWTVVGVLPGSTPLLPTSTETIDVWMPLGQSPVLLGRDVSHERTFRAFFMIAKLRADVTPERVAEELQTIGARIKELHPDSSRDWEWETRPLASVVTRELRGPMAAMVGGAALLLVVGIANVLGLFVQRARRTAASASVSVALGASRADLLRIATIEAALLWLPGAIAGLGLAASAIRLRESWMPFPLPPHLEVSLEPLAIVVGVIFAIGFAVATGVVTSAWWWRQGARAVLGGGRGVADPMSGRAVKAGLAVQVALAAVLTVTGLLTYMSIARLAAADIGFNPDRLVTLRVDVPAELRSADQVNPTAERILTALKASPVAEDATFWAPHVPAQAVWHSSVRVFDRPDLGRDGQLPVVRIHQIDAGAATLLGLRFVEGTDFTAGDRQSGRRVALVSESAAREWWGETSAVGRQIQRWNHDAWSTVVGVVADAPLAGRQGEGSDFVRDAFFLHAQDPQRPLVFLVRTRSDDATAMAAARDAVRGAAPDLPLYAVRMMSDIVRSQEQVGRSTARLGAMFALLALGLVGVGLYGLLANLITRRAMEISLRKALGASTARILREVIAPTLRLFVVGGAAGLGLAWLVLPQLLTGVLFQMDTDEPSAYLAAALILVVAMVPALVGPALQGASKSPAGVLRSTT